MKEKTYIYYDKLSCSELEELLKLDSELPQDMQMSSDELFYILDLLSNSDEYKCFIPDIEDSINNFEKLPINDKHITSVFDDFCNCESSPNSTDKKQKKHFSHIRKHQRILRWTAAILAVLILSIFTPSAMGGSIFEVIALWTADTFSIKTSGNDPSNNTPSQDTPPQDVADTQDILKTLRNILKSTGKTNNLLPWYIPDGYSLVRYNIIIYENFESYNCELENNDSTIQIGLETSTPNTSAMYTKDDIPPEEYIINGTTYYIFTNMNRYKAVWVKDGMECCIMGVPALDEIKKILNSI